MEIHKIFIKRIGFSLIRVHRQQNIVTSLPESDLLLNNLKWPIETLFIGLRPQSQRTDLGSWHRFTSVNSVNRNLPNLITKGSTFAGAWTAGAAYPATGTTVNVTVTPTFTQATAVVPVYTKTLDRITVSAHGIPLYNDMPADFFHQYTTYTYGGPNIRAPDDEGVIMIPFNLYPGSYQPSGHVNISRAREFYIKYTSSVIGVVVSGVPTAGELVIVGSAINFLLISDGSAVLRYST